MATGLGAAVGACDPAPHLRIRKLRKFMGVQDDLAVVAAAGALAQAGLAGAPLGERAGLYLAVGYLPFEQADIDTLLRSSVDEVGAFSMARFSTAGFQNTNPLLTFRCLSNMPAFHVSVNFGLEGPYFVTYPGPGQLYLALEEALAALGAGAVDVALVGGVAHQRNFLVGHHLARVGSPCAEEKRNDAGGFMVLELASRAAARGAKVRAKPRSVDVRYCPHDPFEITLEPVESLDGTELARKGERVEDAARRGALIADEYGAASLPVALARAAAGHLWHEVDARDGISAESAWDIFAAPENGT